MSDLKVSHLALVLRAIGQVNARYGERDFPYVGNEIAAVLPVPSRRWVQPAVAVAGSAALGAIALALSPAGPHRAIAAVYLLTGLVILPLLSSLVVPARVRVRLSRPDAERVEAPALASALAPARLDVFVVPGGGQVAGQSLGRAFRMWGRGTIILRPVLRTANPDLVRFITAHEAAHVARGDGLNATLAAAFAIGLAAALAAGNPGGLWLLLPALAAMVVNRWAGELACDRIAARATGRIPSLEFASYLTRVRQSTKMTPAKRLRSLLTHPPASMRRKAITRAWAGTGSLFPAADPRGRPARRLPGRRDGAVDTGSGGAGEGEGTAWPGTGACVLFCRRRALHTRRARARVAWLLAAPRCRGEAAPGVPAEVRPAGPDRGRRRADGITVQLGGSILAGAADR